MENRFRYPKTYLIAYTLIACLLTLAFIGKLWLNGKFSISALGMLFVLLIVGYQIKSLVGKALFELRIDKRGLQVGDQVIEWSAIEDIKQENVSESKNGDKIGLIIKYKAQTDLKEIKIDEDIQGYGLIKILLKENLGARIPSLSTLELGT